MCVGCVCFDEYYQAFGGSKEDEVVHTEFHDNYCILTSVSQIPQLHSQFGWEELLSLKFSPSTPTRRDEPYGTILC